MSTEKLQSKDFNYKYLVLLWVYDIPFENWTISMWKSKNFTIYFWFSYESMISPLRIGQFQCGSQRILPIYFWFSNAFLGWLCSTEYSHVIIWWKEVILVNYAGMLLRIAHLFLGCSFAKEVWRHIAEILGITVDSNWQSFYTCLCYWSSRHRSFRTILLLYVFWGIWISRNAVIF